ncbi:MAG TPA: hypothetical protein H9961_04590 [Candidatus Duodenibacillus intestinavium]|nr:hypothetical protein [Candidatus Duodenibacillus intestinavium]
MTWLKYLGAALAAVAIFASGYKYAAAIYEADIADMQAQHALALKEKTDEYRAKEQSQAQQLADAWDVLERARAESVSLRGDVDRVRKLADNYRDRLSAASPDSCDALRKRLASCTKLLEEGAKLSAEGAELAQRIAEKKDALSTVTGLAY